MFGIINMIMKVAPIGAFGAMAFTIGQYGVGSLVQLGQLMLCFYITCVFFILLCSAVLPAAMASAFSSSSSTSAKS